MSVHFSSVAQSCLTLQPHELQHARPPCPSPIPIPISIEPTHTHIHWVNDVIQPSHPLSSPFPPALNLSQQQDLFKWVSSLHQVAKVLAFLFSISPSNVYSGLSFLGWTGWISLQSKGLSRVFSNTIDQKHRFFGAQLSLYSNSHIHTWPLEKPCFYL